VKSIGSQEGVIVSTEKETGGLGHKVKNSRKQVPMGTGIKKT
jgi:hypothetical protein